MIQQEAPKQLIPGRHTCAPVVDKQSGAILDDVISYQLPCSARAQHGGQIRGQDNTAGANTQVLPILVPKQNGEQSSGRQTSCAVNTVDFAENQGAATAMAGPGHRASKPGTAMTVQGQQADDSGPPHTQPPLLPTTGKQPDFNYIGKVCQKDLYDTANVDLRPVVFAEHRRNNWPRAVQGTFPDHLVKIYEVVRETGLPNAQMAKIPLPSNLNIDAWEQNLAAIGGRPQLMEFLHYGFPLGYVGPVSDSMGTPNHPSATDYPIQVGKFLSKEKELGGIVGPFEAPPFQPWCHMSPLMSRPKSDPGARRVITDMTFPQDKSINAFVIKNGIYGIEMEHTLPTVDNLVQYLRYQEKGVYLATLDISRAYKNFLSDPLDWPLLCFEWKGQAYCDVTVPFGSRASSFHMQTVAQAIVDILHERDVKSYMYLDDLIIVSPNRTKAERDFQMARDLFNELALPEALEKSQRPATKVKWLGVNIGYQRDVHHHPTRKIG